MPEYIAIGDIHGMADLLLDLLPRLPREGELVFLGDYIDRGPGSKAVLDRLSCLAQERPCHFLRGNHEAMLLAALDGDRVMEQFWLRNGGLQLLESYAGRPTPEHVTFLRQAVPYFATDDYIFVHAGLRPAVTLLEQTLDDLLWIRDPFLRSSYDWGRRVIHGHTPIIGQTPEILHHRINVDTGAVYGGALTALLLPECISIAIPAS